MIENTTIPIPKTVQNTAVLIQSRPYLRHVPRHPPPSSPSKHTFIHRLIAPPAHSNYVFAQELTLAQKARDTAITEAAETRSQLQARLEQYASRNRELEVGWVGDRLWGRKKRKPGSADDSYSKWESL